MLKTILFLPISPHLTIQAALGINEVGSGNIICNQFATMLFE